MVQTTYFVKYYWSISQSLLFPGFPLLLARSAMERRGVYTGEKLREWWRCAKWIVIYFRQWDLTGMFSVWNAKWRSSEKTSSTLLQCKDMSYSEFLAPEKKCLQRFKAWSPFNIVVATGNPDQNMEDYLFQVISKKRIRIPRFLSVKAASIFKGFQKFRRLPGV